MSNKNETFDWAGDAGKRFAEWNPPNAAGVDVHWNEYYGKPATQILARALEAIKQDGLDVAKAKGNTWWLRDKGPQHLFKWS